MTAKKIISRGIRNNNPLNIRVGNNWQGEVENPSDKEFEQFISLEMGLRAGFIIIRRYIEKYSCKTIKRIIERWAPPSENDTKAYISIVARHAGVDPNRQLSFEEASILCSIVQAMAFVETGQLIERAIIVKSYTLV